MVISNFYVGWKEEFDRYPGMKLEYVPLDVAWKAAFFVGMKEHYPHFFAKSGYFALFLYDLDRYWVYDIFQVQLVENALNGANVQRYFVEPKSLDEAMNFIYQMINSGNLVWATYFEPILIYGIEGDPGNERVHWYSPRINPGGEIWGRDEIERWWNAREQLGGSHTLIAPAKVVPGVNTEEGIATELARLAVENWESEHLAIGDTKIPIGAAAYDRYIADLKNPEVDFTKKFGEDRIMFRMAWLSMAIYAQWTQYFAAHTYFAHIADLFPREQAELLRKTAECYSDAYGFWLEWEKYIGRTDDENEFIKRAQDMQRRQKGAQMVERAKESIAEAVRHLKEFLSLRGDNQVEGNE